MSKKQQVYYPLQICKEITAMQPKMAFTIDEMRVLTEGIYSADEKEAVVERCIRRVEKANMSVPFRRFSDLPERDINGMDFWSTVLLWSRNKQVYRFDPDFLNELIETENLHFTKDMWNYLPCKLFYLDISDNKELCERFQMQGAFVNVVKDEKQDSWEIHTFRMMENIRYRPQVLPIKNQDSDFNWDLPDLQLMMAFMSLQMGTEEMASRKNNAISLMLLPQVLCYLASVEPDIRVSEPTRQNYRKPNPNTAPKNKFSEVHEESVGVRFGSAFRKWSVSYTGSSQREHHATGHTKRPHFRRAHWTHYWYNVTDDFGNVQKNDEGQTLKVRRAKWVEGTYVNEKLGEAEAEAVVHAVKKPKKSKQETFDV